ncbi:MAG: hypothetical protein JWM44_1914 [Bacilli bacterium]|nr:hypothetical protein [Bacilli bacterium]
MFLTNWKCLNNFRSIYQSGSDGTRMVKNLNAKDLQKELQDFITKAHSDGSMDSVQLLVQDLKQRLLQYIDQRWVEDV